MLFFVYFYRKQNIEEMIFKIRRYEEERDNY